MVSGVNNVRKSLILIFLLILGLAILTGCSGKESASDSPTASTGNEMVESGGEQLTEEAVAELKNNQLEAANEDQLEGQLNNNIAGVDSKRETVYYSPFTGKPLREKVLVKAVMASIENSPPARPQSGLGEASLVYEFLVEGGITRFLALYWEEIPDKIGPIRSVRPYLIETALEYDALLLHAGASPAGFDMLDRTKISHLDQIYHGSYYWRSSLREAPHNLYTGGFKIKSYLSKLTGQEYGSRFSFQQISFIEPEDIRANKIYLNYWGSYRVCYRFDETKNLYYRYLVDFNHPHLTVEGKQLTARNIIVQFVDTGVIDSVGRLKMTLTGKGESLVFRDGIVIKGYWEKKGKNWTKYFNEEGKEIKLNPGKTWIQIVPRSTRINYEE